MKEIKLSDELTQLDGYIFARKVDSRIEIFEAVAPVALDGNTLGYSLRDKVISGSDTVSCRWWVWMRGMVTEVIG
jgi:hypothetical protein